MDEKKVKKLATTEQVENMRVQIVRELVAISMEHQRFVDLLTKDTYERTATEELMSSRLKRMYFVLILPLPIVLFGISYLITIVIKQLSALGL